MKCLSKVSLIVFIITLPIYGNSTETLFNEQERKTILSFGPWPPTQRPDISNRFSGNKKAIKLGKGLFFDKNLSKNNIFACASCHAPDRHFSDGLNVSKSAHIATSLTRNTPSILNLANNRWFGWGGETDSLWAHSIRPLLSPLEMGNTASNLKQYINQKSTYRKLYFELAGKMPDQDTDNEVLVTIAKALASFQETLISPASSFDSFREALLKNNKDGIEKYSASAQRGLKLFIGEGRCNLCHFGSKFSSGEFADIGIPFLIKGGVDPGRYIGIKEFKTSPYNQMGAFNDAPKHMIKLTQYVRLQHRNWGEFKVPSLRGIRHTAPYMHNGSIPTLEGVIEHYNNINMNRLHVDGERILRPLNLTKQQTQDLLTFLKSL